VFWRFLRIHADVVPPQTLTRSREEGTRPLVHVPLRFRWAALGYARNETALPTVYPQHTLAAIRAFVVMPQLAPQASPVS
jgi:hypothetical protein